MTAPALPTMMSKAMQVGFVKGEPTVNTTGTGKKVANFSLYTGKTTGTFRIVAWEDLAEKVFKEVHDKAHVLIEGRLANRKYMDKTSGADRWITEVTITDLTVLDPGEAPSF